jgi:hypothetical protein
MSEIHGFTTTCVECGEYVISSANKQHYCHDVCSQRGAIKRAIEYLQKADGILANESEPNQAAAASVEDALTDLCNDFDWKPPVAKPSGRETWMEGRARSWTMPGAV